MKSAVAYVRTSTARQNLGLDAQLAAIKLDLPSQKASRSARPSLSRNPVATKPLRIEQSARRRELNRRGEPAPTDKSWSPVTVIRIRKRLAVKSM
jgi:hypothetical protein